MAQKNNSITFKGVITGLFIAMAVFTVAMITVTIVKMNKAKNELNINPDEVNLVQLETIKGNIADDALVAIVETDIGEIRAELYPQYAPNTVANFKKLADSEYYNGTFIYEIKKEMEMKREKMKNISLYDIKEPSFIYKNGKISNVDIELVKNHPRSYFYEVYMSGNRTNNGDIFIDENIDFSEIRE